METEQLSSLPFPRLADLSMLNMTETEDIAPTLNVSPASSSNSEPPGSSSGFTSSDKLSALPFPLPSIPPQRQIERTSNFATNIKRAYRRSFDGTLSLPTLSSPEHEPLKHGTKSLISPHETATRFRGGNMHIAARDLSMSGKDTPHQRVSFESDRNSLPTMPSVGQAISRITSRESEKQSKSVQSSSGEHPESRSPSQSRATSPLRIIRDWSSGFHRSSRPSSEERFVPIDPFRFKTRMSICGIGLHPSEHDLEAGEESSSPGAYNCEDIVPVSTIRTFLGDTAHFLGDTLPREVYLNLLLRLPAMYFSRVARIFEDADVSRPDIQRMIETSGGTLGRRHAQPTAHTSAKKQPPLFPEGASLTPGVASGIGLTAQAGIAPTGTTMMHMPLPFPDEWTPSLVSPALIRFKHSWEAFIDSLLREWKTLNVVSALLASAILTLFQIPEAADDPLTRTSAFLSLICALMSLSYGCIYIVRFGTMRSMFHASRWAEEARRMNTAIAWNVWVLLATPAVWMAWSMILFLLAILSFVWRTGAASDPTDRTPLRDRSALGPRVLITSVLLLGMIYLAMIVKTLRRYGSNQPDEQSKGRPQGPPRKNKLATKLGGVIYPTNVTQGDEDAEVERRGRDRQRSTSSRVRREEDTKEVRYGGPKL